MTTFVLTWNPLRTVWPFWDGVGDLPEEEVEGFWSTGGRKFGMVPGDRFFMLKQGPPPRGVVASGSLTTEGFETEHWDADRAGDTANSVGILFDTILAEDDLLPVDDLIAQVEGLTWTEIQNSGQQLSAPGDTQLEALWAAHVGHAPPPQPPTGTTPPPTSSRQSDAARRAAVEDHAQAMLEDHFRARGWTVHDCRYGNPYDARATRDGQTRYLEAKGTEGDGARVEVTSGEVNHARRHAGECVIGVVSGVEVNPDGATTVPGSGTLRLHAWDPDSGVLIPSRYTWAPPAG